MDLNRSQEEKLREACCFGDSDAVKTLISRGVKVNSQHDINKWTGLHWACKRGHVDIVRVLLSSGAETDIENNQGLKPADLTTNAHILQLLGSEVKTTTTTTTTLETTTSSTSTSTGITDSSSHHLPITPNYLAHPPVDYKVNLDLAHPHPPSVKKNPFGKPLTNGIDGLESVGSGSGSGGATATTTTTATTQTHAPTPPHHQHQEQLNKEMVLLKVRVAYSEDTDFIEVEFPKSQMSYSSLLTHCCRELAINNPHSVDRIRKLPNTRLRNDRDTQRLTDFTELELVLKGQRTTPAPPPAAAHTLHSTADHHQHHNQHQQSTSKNNYSSIHGFKNQTILY